MSGSAAFPTQRKLADSDDSSVPHPARILVVEDEPGLAEVLALHLAAAGFDVRTALDGLAALYELGRESPDLVLLDLQLLEVSGFRLMQLLKRRDAARPVPVLVLTALSYQEAREVARAGADDFLEKPFSPHEVVVRAVAARAHCEGQ